MRFKLEQILREKASFGCPDVLFPFQVYLPEDVYVNSVH